MTHFTVMPRALARSAMAFAAAALVSGASMAATLMSDDFQGDLSQWQAGGSAVIVADPLVSGGKALAFNAGAGGGDLFSAQSYASSTGGHFTLSYDYLGIDAGGGYVGVDVSNGNATWEMWLAGDGSYGAPNVNPNTGKWEHVSFSFQSSFPITLKLEQWYGQNGTPQQAMFKNLVLSEAGNVSSVPEPGAYALVLGGLVVVAASRRRTARRAA